MKYTDVVKLMKYASDSALDAKYRELYNAPRPGSIDEELLNTTFRGKGPTTDKQQQFINNAFHQTSASGSLGQNYIRTPQKTKASAPVTAITPASTQPQPVAPITQTAPAIAKKPATVTKKPTFMGFSSGPASRLGK
jgi:hypothetical protein